MADESVGVVTTQEPPTIVPAYQELTPTPQQTQPTPQRQRDASGKFVGQAAPADEPAASPETPAPVVAPAAPKFSQNLVDLAKSAYYTDEQIAKFDDPALLYDAIRGRAAAMQPQYQQGQPSIPLPPQPAAPAAAEGFKLELDETEITPELVKPLRAMEAATNKAMQENQQLRQKLAQLEGAVQQSAVSTQQVTAQQQAGFWDQIAASVPGLVETIGKPSSAMTRLGTPQANEWADVAQFISARAQAQRVPEPYIDYAKATQEGWTAYRAIKGNGNGQSPGSAALPGVAIHSSPRQSSAPVPKANMTPQEDYDYRMANMRNAFQQAGGNPFAL